MHLCPIDQGGQSAMGISALCYIYLKLIWCNGFPKIYDQLAEEVGSIYHGYICIVLYMKLIWCNGFSQIYAQLAEGVGSICHGYMYIVLYIYETYCGVMVFQRSVLNWRRGWGQSAMGICALCYI